MKKFFSLKIVKVIISILLAITLIVCVSSAIFVSIGTKTQYGTATGYDWSEDSEFSSKYVKSLDMGDDEYKILCLTDIHIRNHATFASELGINFILDGMSKIQLKKLINKEKPNLIIITGDTVLTKWNDIELEKFVEFMDEFKTPWAHIYGNHDYEGRADKAKLSNVLLDSEYGLFEVGPNDFEGMGNYILSLERDAQTKYAMFMFDDGEHFIVDDTVSDGGISKKQISWYKWAMNGINQKAGQQVPNMAFMHVPVPEYKEIDESKINYGSRGEDSYTALVNYGFFDVFKESNGTHLFAGHDHSNDFAVDYNGVSLNYVEKSSYNCYFSSGKTGGTVITIDKNNNVNVAPSMF